MMYGYVRVSSKDQNEARPLPENFCDCVKAWKTGQATQTEAARACGMPLSSFRYRLKDFEEEKVHT